MPAGPGESLLTTLFADIHYYYSDPAAKPLHHRFSKGSYLYVYFNATTRQAKIEIANHAGTPEQDAFSGSLSTTSVDYSGKHPTLFTLRPDAALQDQSQWHLPSYDLRNEQKYMYKLHSLDIYLWTEKDAASLLNHLTSLIPSSRLSIRDAPSASAPQSATTPAEHRDSMSPVVQQLEQTAIASHFPSQLQRAESVVSTQSYPGPPTPATSPPVASPQPQQSFGYNPAAPSAPEPIAHREKTPPPPEDGAPGTQYAGIPPGYGPNSNQVTPQHAYFAGPPQQSAGAYATPPAQSPPPNQHRTFSGIPPPPPGGPSPVPQQYAPSFGAPPTSPPPQQQHFQGHRQSSFGLPGQQTQYAKYPSQQQAYGPHQQFAQTTQPSTPSFGPFAAQSPGLPPNTPGYGSLQQPPTPSAPPAYAGHTPLQSPGLPPPPSTQPPGVQGFSTYAYTPSAQSAQAQQALNSQGAYTGDVHNQVYRPTESEQTLGRGSHGHGHAGGHGSASSAGSGGGGSAAGSGGGIAGMISGGRPKMEQRVSGVEKRVGGFLKRLDKLI